jgi:hypothetical protein
MGLCMYCYLFCSVWILEFGNDAYEKQKIGRVEVTKIGFPFWSRLFHYFECGKFCV